MVVGSDDVEDGAVAAGIGPKQMPRFGVEASDHAVAAPGDHCEQFIVDRFLIKSAFRRKTPQQHIS